MLERQMIVSFFTTAEGLQVNHVDVRILLIIFRAHFPNCIGYQFVLPFFMGIEQFHNISEALPKSYIFWCLTSSIQRSFVLNFIHNQSANLFRAFQSSIMKWCPTIFIARIFVINFVDQIFADFQVTYKWINICRNEYELR